MHAEIEECVVLERTNDDRDLGGRRFDGIYYIGQVAGQTNDTFLTRASFKRISRSFAR
jgi:hypothetical protein